MPKQLKTTSGQKKRTTQRTRSSAPGSKNSTADTRKSSGNLRTTGPGLFRPLEGVGQGDHQGTPVDLFRLLDREFNFTHDLFANDKNALCNKWFTIDRPLVLGSAEMPRNTACFANPPYSKTPPGVDTGITYSLNLCKELAAVGNNTVVVLHRMDCVKWMRKIVAPYAAQVRWPDCRFTFRGKVGQYNHPCCVTIFTPKRAANKSAKPKPVSITWWPIEQELIEIGKERIANAA